MGKMRGRLYVAGCCMVGVLLLTSCGETEEGSGSAVGINDNITESTTESVPFSIKKDETEGASETIGTMEETQLLVAIDNSGSMGPSVKIIHDTTEMISALVKKELPTSAVEYMLFNADKAEFVSADDLFPINYGGETSIYLGMEQINTWVEERVRENEEQGIRTALILFSDLYSSRTVERDHYTEETAQGEQEDIDTWTQNWKMWIEDGSLDVCVIQWESMAAEESSSRTLEQDLDSYSTGFQVQLSSLEDHILQLGDVQLDKNNQNVQTEQRVVGDCLERVLEVITGVTGQTWGEEKWVAKWNDNRATINIYNECRLIVRVDSDKPGSEQAKFYYSGSEEECSAERIFQGEVTDVYILESVPIGTLDIQVADVESQHVYCLAIPRIKMEAEFEKSSGRIAVGEEIVINITAKCEERDIRWKDTDLPLEICIKIEDMDDSSRIIYKETLSAHPGESFILVPGIAGNFSAVVYYTDPDGNKQKIGRAILNVY